MASDNWSKITPDVAAIMGVVDTAVRWQEKQRPARTYAEYHPSEFGKCLRKLQYKRYASLGFIPEQKKIFDSKTLRLFGKGHNMHERWTTYFETIGVLRGYWKCKNPFCEAGGGKRPKIVGRENKQGVFKPAKCDCGCKDFEYMEVTVQSDELNMVGHADMVLDFTDFDIKQFGSFDLGFASQDLPEEPVVVDMKTIKDSGFGNILRSGPHLEYQIQLTIYANLLDMGYGLLIYENKNDSRTASFKIPRNTDTIFKTVQKQTKLMNEMVEHKLLPPPRPAKKDSYECRYCPFSAHCKKSPLWTDSELDQKRRKFYGILLQS